MIILKIEMKNQSKAKKTFFHSLILVFAIFLGFVLPKTSLVNYELQIIAFLFIILYLAKKYFLPKSQPARLIESIVFTLVVLWIVNTTGGLKSSFFFLIYFLLFSLSMLLEPIISLITSLTIMIFFILIMPSDQTIKEILPVISLAFISPFALFLGQEYFNHKKEEEKNIKLVNDTFLFLSLMLKQHLKNIDDLTENYIGDHQLHQIKKNSQRMKKLIEEFEKKI